MKEWKNHGLHFWAILLFSSVSRQQQFLAERYGNGSIASHQKATLYTAAGSADQRLKVHKVSGGCQLLSDLNNAYGLNIYGTKAGSVCDFYPVSGNLTMLWLTFWPLTRPITCTVSRWSTQPVPDSGIQFERCCSDVGKCIQCRQSDLAALRVPVQRWRQYGRLCVADEVYAYHPVLFLWTYRYWYRCSDCWCWRRSHLCILLWQG